jgi:ubiquinone/menaquinone biosynthesis C-methylase UbiE
VEQIVSTTTGRGSLARRLIITMPARKLIQVVQNRFYDHVHRRVSDDVVFMNYGYEEDPPMGIPLDPDDEPDRYPIQLYRATATQAGGLAGKHVIEVGCGRGGGASYLTRTLREARYIGLDLNAAGVKFCQRRHQVPGLEFVTGNAQDIPFPDESFDAVVNIESSHCYPHFGRFLQEVVRVLRPGGAFLYADVRRRGECASWDAELRTGLSVVSWREINAEVLRGMEHNSTRSQSVADQMTPRFLRRWGRRGVPGRGTAVWQAVRDARVAYRIFCLAKAT